MEILIKARHFRALLAVAPKLDIRHYLKGAYIDTKQKTASATDGRRLIQVPIQVVSNKFGIDNVLVSLPASKPFKRDTEVKMEISRNPDMPEEVTWSYLEKDYKIMRTQTLSHIIDGKFPNIENIKPNEKDLSYDLDGEGFNPFYFADIASEIGATAIRIKGSGRSNPAIVEFYGGSNVKDVYYLVMPIRI